MITIDSRSAAFEPRHGRAIVSLVIGDEYAQIWRVMCQANWQAYADRHGYDLLIVTAPLDASPRGEARSPAWQKLLILDQPWSGAYERIVWIDADIIISNTAPDIVTSVRDPSRLGVCISGDQMSEAEKHIYVERMHDLVLDPSTAMQAWSFHEGNRMVSNGIADESVPMLSTGVLVLSPQAHNAALLETYAREDAGRLYEQPHLSEVLHRRGLVQRISPRFNWLVHETLVLNFPNWAQRMSDAETEVVVDHMRREMQKAYFLHFAGSMNLLRYIARRTEEGAASSIAEPHAA